MRGDSTPGVCDTCCGDLRECTGAHVDEPCYGFHHDANFKQEHRDGLRFDAFGNPVGDEEGMSDEQAAAVG